MKIVYFIILCTLGLVSNGLCQAPGGSVFGGFHNATPDIKDKIGPQQRQVIYREIKDNIRELARKGITPQSMLREKMAVQFILPLRQAAGFNDPGFYGISGFVDNDVPKSGREYRVLFRN